MSLLSKNYFFNMVLTLSNVIFPVLTFPYASRILGPLGIGKVQFAVSFTQYFVLVSALGIPIYGMREVAKFKENLTKLKSTFTHLFLLNLVSSLVVFIFYIMLIYSVPKLSKDVDLYLVSGMSLFLSFFNVDWFLGGIEKFRYIALRSLVVKVLLFFVLFLTVLERSDIVMYLWIVTGASILNNIINIYYVRSYLSGMLFSWSDLLSHTKPLLLIFATVVAASVYSSLDTVILGFLKGFQDVGYYSAAARINRMVIPFLTALPLVLLPQITSAFRQGNNVLVKDVLDKSLEYVAVIGVPVSVVFIALAPELVFVLAGNEFEPAITSLQIMAPVVLIISLSTVLALQVLTPAEKDSQASFSVLLGLVVSLALNFLLIPKWSHIGSAIANLFAELFVLISFWYFSSRVVAYKLNFKSIVVSLSLSSFFFPYLFCLRILIPNSHGFVLTLGILGCGLFYLIFRVYFFRHDLLYAEFQRIAKGVLYGS